MHRRRCLLLSREKPATPLSVPIVYSTPFFFPDEKPKRDGGVAFFLRETEPGETPLTLSLKRESGISRIGASIIYPLSFLFVRFHNNAGNCKPRERREVVIRESD